MIGLGFFFRAEDGIRDLYVTGVQTCALPIYTSPATPPAKPGSNATGSRSAPGAARAPSTADSAARWSIATPPEIGRARVGKECRCCESPEPSKKKTTIRVCKPPELDIVTRLL